MAASDLQYQLDAANAQLLREIEKVADLTEQLTATRRLVGRLADAANLEREVSRDLGGQLEATEDELNRVLAYGPTGKPMFPALCHNGLPVFPLALDELPLFHEAQDKLVRQAEHPLAWRLKALFPPADKPSLTGITVTGVDPSRVDERQDPDTTTIHIYVDGAHMADVHHASAVERFTHESRRRRGRRRGRLRRRLTNWLLGPF